MLVLVLVSLLFSILPTNINFIQSSRASLNPSSGWQYCKQIAISNPVESYQMRIHLVKGSGTDNASNGTIYLNNYCQNFPYDIRFGSTSDPSTAVQLPQWLEENTTTDCYYWINTTTANYSTIYLFVGNSGASEYSSGDDTFINYFAYGDASEFTENNIDVSDYTDSELGNCLRFYNPTTSSCGESYANVSPNVDQYEVRFKFRTVSLGSDDQLNFIVYSSSLSNRYSQTTSPHRNYQSNVRYLASGSEYDLYTSYTEGNIYYIKHIIDETDSSSGIDYYVYDSNWNLLASATGKAFAYGSPSVHATNIYFGDGTSHGKIDARVKYIFFKKYADTEPTWSSFGSWTAIGGGNNAPNISNEYPTNESTEVSLQPTCHIDVSDADGDTMNICWYENTTGSWVLQQTNSSVGNGTYYWTYTNASSYDTTYWWKVAVNDGTDNTTAIYHFTTATNEPPQFSNENPSNGSTNQPLSLTWSIDIIDPDGDTFNWTIECSNGQSNSGNDDTNGTKSLSLSGLAYNTNYTVWVNATDSGSEEWTNATYWFITASNSPPTQSNPSPSNGATDVEITLSQLSIDISDPEGDTFNWTIETSPNIGSASGNNENNGTKTCSVSGLNYGTTYTWYVNATDGNSWNNQSYTFTTRDAYTPANPSDFTATTDSRFQITLTWIDDSKADSTLVEYSLSSDATWDRGDHTQLYNGTAETYVHDNLLPGTTYYYKAWSYNATDNVWSSGTTTSNTTISNNPPSLSNESPSNGSTNQNLSLTWNISIADADGDSFNWTIECSNGQNNSSTNDTNGTKSLSLSGLDYDTTYKVWVNVTDGYNWTKEWYTFTTRNEYVPDPPSSFTATDVSPSQIDLSWNKGTKADTTYIERNTVASWSRGAGTEIYNSTGTSYSDTGLNAGTTYYYQAWSYNATDNVYSSTYASANATTIGSATVVTNESTGVEETNATLHGYLQDDGGENCSVWFEWGTTTSYGNVTLSRVYSSDTSLGNPIENCTNVPTRVGWKLNNFTGIIHNVSFYSKKVGSPTGHVRVTIRYQSNDTIIAYSERDASSLTSSASWDNVFTFYNMPYLSNADIYVLLEYGYDVPCEDPNYVKFYYKGWGSTSNCVQYKNSNYYSYTDIAVSIYYTTQNYIQEGTEFSYNLSGLSPGTLYHYRAVANNSNSTVYGSDKTFLTKPYEPSSLTATSDSDSSISLSWTKGSGADKTVIVRKTGDYPANVTDGTVVYNDTGTSYTDSGLSAGTKYYYRAWSYAEDSGLHQYSDLNASANAYTYPSAPTNLQVTGYTNISISLSWSKGSGADTTKLYRGSTLIYNGTGTTYTDTGLSPSTQYIYKAYSYNNESGLTSQSYASVSQYTKPSPPTDFSLSGDQNIYISWTKGDGADYTLIRYSNNSYPSTIADGVLIYNGTGTSTYFSTNESLLYISAWGYYSSSNLYSSKTDILYIASLNPPTLSVAYLSNKTINVSWTVSVPSGVNHSVMVRYSTSDYPTSRSSGTLLINSSTANYTYLANVTDSDYYFSAWTYGEKNGSSKWSSTYSTAHIRIYVKNISIVNEETGNPFNLSKVYSFIVSAPEKNWSIDLKSENTTTFEYNSSSKDLLKFSVKYNSSSTDIVRYINISLISESNFTVGYPENDTTFYEQLIYSKSRRAVLMKNIEVDCYILAAYTQFVQEDVLTIPGYTINKMYRLFTYDGSYTVVGLINGGKASEINLDLLLYNTTVDISIPQEDVAIKKVSSTLFLIYYKNTNNDNSKVRIQIYDGDDAIFDYNDTSTPNEVSLYFDISGLSLNNTDLKIKVTAYRTDGSRRIIAKYFSTTEAYGVLNPAVAAFLSVGLMIFGLSLVATRHAFGIVGIILCGISIAITALATTAWYVTFFQAIFIIILIVLIIIYKEENSRVV